MSTQQKNAAQEEASAKDEAKNIFTEFSRSRSAKKGVRFLNTYRAMPVSFSGEILDVSDEGIALFSATALQIASMKLNGMTHIHGETLSQPVKALIREGSTNPYKEQVLIRARDVKYSKSGVGDRKVIRVEPEQPIEGEVHTSTGGRYLDIFITDIGLGGIGAFASVKDVVKIRQNNKAALAMGEVVSVKYFLPLNVSDTLNLFCDGVIRSLIKTQDNKCRIGIELNLDVDELTILKDYLGNRQRELVAELRAISHGGPAR